MEFRFQLGNPPLVVPHDRLNHQPHVRRQSGQLFRTDRQRRHPQNIADFSIRANPNYHPEL